MELEDWNWVSVNAKYGKFNNVDEQTKYRLKVGSYSGTARDSLGPGNYDLNNMAFTTKDRDKTGTVVLTVLYDGLVPGGTRVATAPI